MKMKDAFLSSGQSSPKRHVKSTWESRYRRLFIASLCGASVFLLVSLWLNAAWIYGSLYGQADRAHHFEILVIDLDGGDIGEPFSFSLFQLP